MPNGRKQVQEVAQQAQETEEEKVKEEQAEKE